MGQASTPPELVEAYRLLKAGQRQQAGAVLKPYLEQHRDDARAWWLMAHIVTRPDAVRQCLERVVLLDPTHEKARARLAALSTPPDDEPDDSFFEIPATPSASTRPAPSSGRPAVIRALGRSVAAEPSSAPPTAVWLPGLQVTPEPWPADYIPTFEEFAKRTSAGIDPFTGEPIDSPFADLDRPGPGAVLAGSATEGTQGLPEEQLQVLPAQDEQAGRRVLLYALGGLIVFLVVLTVLVIAEDQGWLKRSGERVPKMKTLNAELFTIDYPKRWDARCLREALGYPVCGIANHSLYNEVERFAGTEIDLGAMIAESLGLALRGEDLPEERLSIIAMDVPPASPAYNDASWARTRYEWYRQGVALDPSARANYEQREIRVDGFPAYYYSFTSEGKYKEAAWDVYVTHGGMVFWLRIDYLGPRRAHIPQATVDAMIESIRLSTG